MRKSPNWPLLALSGAGMILAGYLSWTALHGESVKGCSVGSACDIVLSSHWATLLGLPTAVWGFFAYVALAGTAFVARVDRHWQYAWTLSLFGLLYSAYLTTVSVTVLHAACPYCLTSLGLMTATFSLVTWQRPALTDFYWTKWLTRTIPPAAAVILLLHLNYTGVIGTPPPVEDPTARALAEYLTENGVKFYGASWCPHCQDQKGFFGLAAKRLPYIECSPNGQGRPQSSECQDANIQSYPTWVIKGKRYEQVMTLKELTDASGFKPPPPPSTN